MKTFKLALTLLIVSTTTIRARDTGAMEINSEVREVTVFFSGAEIVNEAVAKLSAGTNEIMVRGLSGNVDINGIRIATEKGVRVSSFEFTHLPNAPNEETRRMNDSLNEAVALVEKIRNDERVNSEFKKTMEKAMTAAIATGNATDCFVTSMDYYERKLKETEDLIFKLKADEKRVVELTDGLNRRIRAAKSDKGLNEGALKISLAAPAATESVIRISYHTSSASWTPHHDINVSDIDRPVRITTGAKVSQSTGIDWNGVRLKLSTSTPSFGRGAPLFRTWILRERVSESTLLNSVPEMAVQNSVFYSRVPGAAEKNGKEEKVAADFDPEPARTATETNEHVAVSENTLNTTYEIDRTYTIPGDGGVRNIELATREIAAEYRHYCAPKLDPNVFVVAEIAEWEKLNLPSGKAGVTYDGTFAGETFIDAGSTGDRLSLTLGKDNRVAVKREKVNEMTGKTAFGADVRQEFSYRITVRNNRPRPVRMILKDQYPVSIRKQIEVVLLRETSTPDVNKPETGVVTRERDIAAGETKSFTMAYGVKYPKEMKLNL